MPPPRWRGKPICLRVIYGRILLSVYLFPPSFRILLLLYKKELTKQFLFTQKVPAFLIALLLGRCNTSFITKSVMFLPRSQGIKKIKANKDL